MQPVQCTSYLKTNFYLQITDEGIYHLAKSCTRLRSVKLKTCEVMLQDHLMNLSKSLENKNVNFITHQC